MTAAIDRVFPDLRWDHGAGCLTLYLAAGPGGAGDAAANPGRDEPGPALL